MKPKRTVLPARTPILPPAASRGSMAKARRKAKPRILPKAANSEWRRFLCASFYCKKTTGCTLFPAKYTLPETTAYH